MFSVHLCCIVFAHLKKEKEAKKQQNAKYLETLAHSMRRIRNVFHALNFRYAIFFKGET